MNLDLGERSSSLFVGRGIQNSHCLSPSANGQSATAFYSFNLTSNVNVKLILQIDAMCLQLQEPFAGGCDGWFKGEREVGSYLGILFFS